MGIDIDKEVEKASELMCRYGVSKDDQTEIVACLVAAGVEHCLNEQDRVRNEWDGKVAKAFNGLVH